MTLIQLLAVALTATALFAFINHSVLRLPTTIGVMVVASVVSLGLAFLNVSGVGLPEWPLELIRSIDFDQTLLHGLSIQIAGQIGDPEARDRGIQQ